jgi:hypothetical protein
MNRLFDHEKLEGCQESVAFVAWLEPKEIRSRIKIAIRTRYQLSEMRPCR